MERKKSLSKPQDQSDRMLVDIAAIGEGILPIYGHDHSSTENAKIPREAKRKFRKLWRKADRWLNGREPTEPSWYRIMGRNSLVSSFLLNKIKKNS